MQGQAAAPGQRNGLIRRRERDGIIDDLGAAAVLIDHRCRRGGAQRESRPRPLTPRDRRGDGIAGRIAGEGEVGKRPDAGSSDREIIRQDIPQAAPGAAIRVKDQSITGNGRGIAPDPVGAVGAGAAPVGGDALAVPGVHGVGGRAGGDDEVEVIPALHNRGGHPGRHVNGCFPVRRRRAVPEIPLVARMSG